MLYFLLSNFYAFIYGGFKVYNKDNIVVAKINEGINYGFNYVRESSPEDVKKTVRWTILLAGIDQLFLAAILNSKFGIFNVAIIMTGHALLLTAIFIFIDRLTLDKLNISFNRWVYVLGHLLVYTGVGWWVTKGPIPNEFKAQRLIEISEMLFGFLACLALSMLIAVLTIKIFFYISWYFTDKITLGLKSLLNHSSSKNKKEPQAILLFWVSVVTAAYDLVIIVGISM